MRRLKSSIDTGSLNQDNAPANWTGTQPGRTVARPLPPELPAKLAEECTTKRLPQCVQSWLTDMEDHAKVVASVGGNPPTPPRLTQDERTTCLFELAVLDQILAPSHTKGDELVVELSTFFSMMPFQKGDESEKRLKINGWCTQLEHYPLYAVKRALGWWLKFGKKEPLFAQVLEDVKLFVGDGVYGRKRMLERLIR